MAGFADSSCSPLDLLRSGEFSDFRLAAFGKEYALHRAVLAKSPYFYRQLRGPWRDAQGSVAGVQVLEAPMVFLRMAFLKGSVVESF